MSSLYKEAQNRLNGAVGRPVINEAWKGDFTLNQQIRIDMRQVINQAPDPILRLWYDMIIKELTKRGSKL